MTTTDPTTKPPVPLPVVPCAGVPITACTPQAAVAEVLRLAADPTRPGTPGADVHLCNAYTLALADTDPALHDLLRSAALNLPDGKGVVWANRLIHRGRDLPAQRVYGPDLFLDVLSAGQIIGLRHYLLGGTPQTLRALEGEVRRRFPTVHLVGADSPPFRPLTEQERVEQRERITASGAQLVWLGLGTPKQDQEAASLAADLPVVLVAVGAAFDFVSGSKPQAPLWMQQHGLEWLFRLYCEPRRLWRRVLWGHPRFILAAVRGALTQATP